MGEPAKYDEWRARRNTIAMRLCAAVERAKGDVCSCFNGDEEPDHVHFASCKRNVEVADKALAELGVPIPPQEERRR